MTIKTTKTTNRVHFTDLDPIRFENLCLALIFPLHPWADIGHYGRLGDDAGIDIYAKERMEDGIEAKLRAERRDLLFTYFGISEAAEARHREATISRNISIKKKLRKELLKNPKEIDWEKARNKPPHKFESSKVIIHSVDDTTYPEIDVKDTGIIGWFNLELWDFYHNGLEFVVGVESAVVDDDDRWSLIEYDQDFDAEKYEKIKLLRLLRIP